MIIADLQYGLDGNESGKIRRVRIHAWGGVQGVGFRPFVFRLAVELGLTGFVANSPQGATIEVQGRSESLDQFQMHLKDELPLPAFLAGLESVWLEPNEKTGFEILASDVHGEVTATILPDIATCNNCLAELEDPGDRRYRYPFINCTHCGPRYSIISALPYDRPNTSMAQFHMCPACRREYEDPRNRRFHAQPIACPECGPQVELWGSDGTCLFVREEAILAASSAIRAGQIVAVKGIGGFHLVVSATDEEAVQRLRQRKHRFAKPMAVMARNLEEAHRLGRLSAQEEQVLTSPARPIVLVQANGSWLASSVAPGSASIGMMLPYSPLHHLLTASVAGPIVATSGNLSEEPICIDENEALCRFENIADLLLVHDRPILRAIDDSVVRIMPQGTTVLRRARGYAPLTFPVPGMTAGTLAVGGHMKASVAVTLNGNVVVGQHIGDLDNAATRDRMAEEIDDLARLFHLNFGSVVHDPHPDYASTLYAKSIGLKTRAIQHHLAHVAACLAENELEGRVLAVAWDGTGFGADRSVWGGEFFVVNGAVGERVAHLRQFLLPGGEIAAREGWRAAYGVLFEALGSPGLSVAEDILRHTDGRIGKLLTGGVRCTSTTSAGRLFDAAAALGAGIESSRFEGDAAMRFEAIATDKEVAPFPIAIRQTVQRLELDWAPTILAICESPLLPGQKSMAFHKALAEGITQIARVMEIESVALTGGCFQNRLLSELVWEALEKAGFKPYGHQRIPPNDGGLAFGQAVAAAHNLELHDAGPARRSAPCA